MSTPHVNRNTRSRTQGTVDQIIVLAEWTARKELGDYHRAAADPCITRQDLQVLWDIIHRVHPARSLPPCAVDESICQLMMLHYVSHAQIDECCA